MTNLDDLRWPHILFRLGILFGIVLVGWLWYRSQKQRVIFNQIVLFCFLWLVFEGLAWAGLRWVWPEFEKPTHLLFRFNTPQNATKPPFYGSYDPDFDVWRLPSDSTTQYRCDDSTLLHFRSNQFGLRDGEYPATSPTSRVVWLGDSFTEGVMVNAEDRISDRIERATGTPQINMGIRSSSTINHYLIYKKLKNTYTHDAVVIGLLPANDFQDYNQGETLSLLSYPIYRPYWTPERQIAYSLANLEHAYASRTRYNRPDLVYATRDSLYRQLSFREKCQVEWTSNSYVWALVQGFAHKKAFQAFQQSNAFNQTVPPAEWQSFLWSFEALVNEAAGKKKALVLYPILYDVLAYQKNSATTLVSQLEAVCKKHGVTLINTLPHLAQHPSPESLYVACDGHFNEAGEAYVANWLLEHPFFQSTVRP